MPTLPTDWSALAALVFLLGLKHGFDADHLATIDGLTRFNARRNAGFARWCGALFSLGHGAVVITIALLVGLASARWQTPAWLEQTGTWISVFFLTLLGVLNLHAVIAAPSDAVVTPVGFKGRFLGRLSTANQPWLVAMVGALFALSFDTISQAALFAMTAGHFGGVGHALLLGFLFMLGMLVTDCINGMWIARLIARSDAIARIASRVMSLAVASVSLLVAAFSAARMLLPQVESWSDGRELWLGAAVMGLIALSFVLGRQLAQRAAPTAVPDSLAP